jgi:hypothetical protein
VDPKEDQRRREVANKVAQHYNDRPQGSLEQRQESPIYQLRCFNNWVKAIRFQRFLRRGDCVLDMGVGKGGDLLKYRQGGIRKLIAIGRSLRFLIPPEPSWQTYEKMQNKYANLEY